MGVEVVGGLVPVQIVDHISETKVDPTFVTETSGRVGGMVSGGVAKVTELLGFDSRAWSC